MEDALSDINFRIYWRVVACRQILVEKGNLRASNNNNNKQRQDDDGDRYYVQTRLHDNSDDKIPSSFFRVSRDDL
jgi:hypothetical protein